MKTVAVIHTGPVTVEPLKARFNKMLPGTRVINIVDDSLLGDVLAAGGLTREVKDRMLQYLRIAEGMGVDIILNGCSSVGEAVDEIQPFIGIPVLKIDEPMAQAAVDTGKKIGVVATVPTTLGPTIRLIEKKAAQSGKAIEIVRSLCEGAFEKILSGDAAGHDRIVNESILQTARMCDVVVLAQVSMARLLDTLGETPGPVLASPDSGVAAVKAALESGA